MLKKDSIGDFIITAAVIFNLISWTLAGKYFAAFAWFVASGLSIERILWIEFDGGIRNWEVYHV